MAVGPLDRATKQATIEVEMYDVSTLGELREFLQRVKPMPDDAQIHMRQAFAQDEPNAIKAVWQTSNPL